MDKSLKKLSRMDLLELLVEATEANESLSMENNELRRSAMAAREQLRQQQRKPVQVAKVGSIAEAALQANGYFEAAQRSADDYLREIKRLRDQVAARSEAQAKRAARQGQAQGAMGEQAQMQEQIQAQVRAQVEHYRQQLQELFG